MSTQAKAKALRTTSRKMNLVAELVRRRTVDDALLILDHTPKKAAQLLKDVVKSAVANAEHNDGLDQRNLYISEILVNEGFTMKRGRAVARGRFHPINKRTTHVTVTLDTIDTETAPASRPQAQKVINEEEE